MGIRGRRRVSTEAAAPDTRRRHPSTRQIVALGVLLVVLGWALLPAARGRALVANTSA